MPPFQYKILRTRKISSGISLKVHPEQGVIVKAPFWVPEMTVKRFVEEKSAWIQKHLNRIISSKAPAKQYFEGEKHLFFGREYPIVLLHVDIPSRTKAEICEDSLQICIYKGHEGDKRSTEIRDALLRFYLETGIGVITEKVNHFSSQIGVEYSQIEIKKVSSIWGSCSPSNKLCFNRKLIMAPHEVVDYVVIHEVCHMVHRNHSSRFWGLVAKFDPQYKEHRRWLHRNHAVLSI